MTNMLNSASNSLGSSTGRGYCVMFLGKIVNSLSTQDYDGHLVTGQSAGGGGGN